MDEKILFTDLDGTLLNDRKEITPGNMEAIREALERGHKIVLSTGRALPRALIQARLLGLEMEGCYIICYNGACIYDSYKKEIIYYRTFPREYAIELFKMAGEQGVHIHAYDDEGVVTLSVNEQVLQYTKNTQLPCRTADSIEEAVREDCVKLLAVDYKHQEPLIRFREAITEWAQGKVDHYFSCPELLEIVPPGVSKGNAIRELCGMLRIPPENTISAGDADNDITMLQATAVSVVMANAGKHMRQYATYITGADNNHDGVAEAIRRFML